MRRPTSRNPRLRSLAATLCLGLAGLASAQSGPALKSATWWDADEAGWGLFTIDQGNVLAPGWFTYDADGEPTWFLVPGALPQADGSWKGDILRFSGVPFDQIAGAAANPSTKIGEATLRFDGDKKLAFTTAIAGTTSTRNLTRFPFGDKDIVCRASTAPRAAASNYSDLWWSPASSGWGVHISHVADNVFATWYTYDADGEAIFLVGAATKQADGSYTGPLVRQRDGTPFTQIDGTPPSSGADPVGSVTLRFADGENASFSYTIGNVTQTKPLTRLQFGNTTSVCAVEPYTTTNNPPQQPGSDECYPPLAVGDHYRLRGTDGNGGNPGETDVEVVGTEMRDGHPVFRLRYTPVGQSTAGEVFEFIEQTASERIHYGSEGFIPEVNGVGTTRFEPPVRTPRATPVGAQGRLVYKAITNYTVMGQTVSSTIDFDEAWHRVGTQTQTSPAGTFTDACKFETTLLSKVSVTTAGITTRTDIAAEAVQWSHPSIGALRTEGESTTSINLSGVPFPIPPTVTNASSIGEIVSASIGGRTFP